MDKIQLGLFGLGHLGRIHLNCLKDIPQFNIVGYYDPDMFSDNEGVTSFGSEIELMAACDAVDIVSSTESHFQLINMAMKRGKHIFVEKPMVASLKEAELIKQALEPTNNLIFQVGHVERFNPAFRSIAGIDVAPLFLEVDRLAPFNQRGTDVSVIMDIMIHDLDIILALVNDEVKSVQANGVKVLSDTPDICNARIEFKKGCVANVTASRISLKQMRKFRIFQKNAYITLDFLEKKSQIMRIHDQMPKNENILELETSGGTKYLSVVQPEIEDTNAILEELTNFSKSILGESKPNVSFIDAYRAIDLANMISQSVLENAQKII